MARTDALGWASGMPAYRRPATLYPLWIDGRLLAPLGITPTYYPAVDYFPLIPWFGVVLLGIWFGNWFYTAANARPAPRLGWHFSLYRGRASWAATR